MTVTVDDLLVHGLPQTYAVEGCRCDVCTAGWVVYCRGRRIDRKTRLELDPTLAVHGKASTYQNWGCRCRPCTEAATVARNQSKAKKEARWRAEASLTTTST